MLPFLRVNKVRAVNYESSHNTWPSIFILYLCYFIVVNDSCSKYVNLIYILQYISKFIICNVIIISNINFLMVIYYNNNFMSLYSIYILFNMISIYYNLYFFSIFFPVVICIYEYLRYTNQFIRKEQL